MKRRITRISVETEREVIVAERQVTRESWCSHCGALVELLDTSETAALLQLDLREVEELLERDHVHSVEVVNGRFLVCSNSLRDKP